MPVKRFRRKKQDEFKDVIPKSVFPLQSETAVYTFYMRQQNETTFKEERLPDYILQMSQKITVKTRHEVTHIITEPAIKIRN